MPTSPRSTLAGIFVLALSIILFEIALTRVFAIMMWHHFTYMVVSVGLLGFGAAGSLLTARRDSLRTDSPVGALSTLSLIYGVVVVVSLVLVSSIRVNSLDLLTTENFVRFAILLPLVTAPFVFGGLAIGMALTRFSRDVGKLYFFDLVGSAAGAAMSVVLLANFGGTNTVFFASLFGLVAALLFALDASPAHRVRAGIGVVLGLALTIACTTGVLRVSIPWAPQKEFYYLEQIYQLPENAGKTIDRLYSATAEVEVGASDLSAPAMGGEFGYRRETQIPARLVGQDGTAPTMLLKDAGKIENFGFLRLGQAGTSYRAFETAGHERPKVLAIGVGGGVDVMVALAHDAREVTAVEINTAMIRMVREDYADYIDDLLTPGAHDYSDRIRLVNSEGRSYLRHSGERFDIIQMSGVDSFTALNTGAYALSESYLYTTDAVREFYEHLTDAGYINYSRFIRSRLPTTDTDGKVVPQKPRETLRLANIAYTALAEMGVEDPERHIAVFRGNIWASTMIKREPFTRAEIDELRSFAGEEGFVGLVYDPLHEPGAPFESTLQAAQRARWQVDKALIEGPLKGVPIVTLERAVDHAVPAWAARIDGDMKAYEAARDAAVEAVRGAGALGFDAKAKAAALRAWFDESLMEELTLDPGEIEEVRIARTDFHALLDGNPDERARFVAEYPFDLSPSTDDKPFFFNYYRWRTLFESGVEKDGMRDPYHPTFPVGQLVLFVSMLQIVVLAFVLILLPLWRLASVGVQTTGAWRYFCYFGSLGLGFMFLEIPMMQKMMLFLGHPTYSLSVVLATILGFAGLGSLVSGRFDMLRRDNFRNLVVAVVVLVVLAALGSRYLLPQLLGYAMPVRIAIAVAFLAPVAFVLGMPFPTGIRLLSEHAPQLMPWGWAINGFLSVFASIFCVALSMVIGFTWVFVLAAVVYLLGFLAVWRDLR
jgi:hypothetical protein